MYIMKYTLCWYLLILLAFLIVEALPNNPAIVPIGGKAVYIKESNSLWVFSFSKSTQSGNKLTYIDLNKDFDTLNPPAIDLSSQITNNQCPVMHYAQAFLSSDGVSINIFGAGSDTSGAYERFMTICQYNTKTETWRQVKPGNGVLARRNAAIEFSTRTNMTYFFGGSAEVATGLPADSPFYPNYWPLGVSMFDISRDFWITTEPEYTTGFTRANATMTEIRDTNGQLVMLGGAIINNRSNIDMVTNFPLASMSDVIVLDPRTSVWSNVKTVGDTAPIGRKHHTTTLHPDGYTLIVIGGEYFNQSGAFLLNDVWTLDTRIMSSYQWSQPPIQGTGLYRSNHTSILIGDQIWVIAGTNSTHKAVDIQLLNVTDWSWSYSAVSSHVPPEQYASIGGVKGFIGIIVGSVGALLLLVSCAVLWWCRRRRVKPANKNQSPAVPPGAMTCYGGRDEPYQDNYQIHQDQRPQTYSDYPQQTDISISTNSKLPSRPSMSTTTSHNNTANDWSNQHPTLTNNFSPIPPPHMNTSSYYVPQLYANGPAPVMSPTAPNDHNRYYDENYYTDSNNNAYNHNELGSIPGYTSATTGGAVHSGDGNPRQLMNYWDGPPRLSPETANFPTVSDNNYFLMPVGQTNDSLPRPDTRVRTSQQLQKPNELDTNLMTSPEASTTLYTSSSAASTATPAYDTTYRNISNDQV